CKSTAKSTPSVTYVQFPPPCSTRFRPVCAAGRFVSGQIAGGTHPLELASEVWSRKFPMLRAALIGFGSTGKSTLFQLMTSARGDSARAAPGRTEATIGISKVPDARLDRLTAMYNPKKRVPATVEFTDLAAPGSTGGAKALVDVAGYKNADALVHVIRTFDDAAVPHPPG